MLCGTRDEEVVRNGGNAVRVNEGIEVKGGRNAESLARVNFEGVVIGRGEEGEGIEGIE